MIMAELKKPVSYKQVLVLRSDLGMSKGKMIAQGAHVACLAMMQASKDIPGIFMSWMDEGYTKIACKVDSLEELVDLEKRAKEMNVPCAITMDLGRTELEPGTVTAIAIGPDTSERVNKITGNLKLL